MEYDEIISLGGSCAPAHQARKNYNSLPAMPFDWWTLKLPEVVPVIESGLDNIFDDEVTHYGEYINRPVLFSRFAIHVHDLPDEIMSDRTGLWKDHLPALRARYSFLGRQLRERASSGDILFVRSWIGEDEYLRDKFVDMTTKIIASLRVTFSNSRIKLLMVDYKCPSLSNIDGVVEDNVTVFNRTDMGCDRGWLEMFHRQGILKRDRANFAPKKSSSAW